ncbi:centromere protein J [Sitodiplosis mosellana]|uniref:centromere protein J n=1 Tax=Sitodiplosis mosellana TaxID=263140 RepID=UPI002443D748|nr:centromere protein J [Sitodiplosis mosellana]
MAANEISLFNSSVSTVDGNASVNNDIENGMNNEDMILARLNELRLWQESQRKSLVENQLDQQKMLELEKQKLYALFGLNADESSLQDAGAYSAESSFGVQHNQQQQQQPRVMNNIYETPKTHLNDSNPSIEQKPLELNSPSINQLQKIIENLANHSPRRDVHHQHEDNANIPKRPYLKRGEGLKNRFKISPDAFRLDNLPKYKYARRMQKHAQSQQLRKQRHQEIPTNDTITSTAGVGVAETFEGQQNNAKDHSIHNRSQSENNRKTVRETTKRPSPQTLQLKLKPNATANKVKPLSSSNEVLHQYNQDVARSVEQAIVPRIKRPSLLSPATKILLDTPTRERVQFQQDEINELKHFVQLEQDFDKNQSALEMDRGRRDDNVVLKFKVGLNLSPKNYMSHRNFGDIEEEEEEEEEENFQHSISSDSSMGDESKHVRFHSRALTIEKDDRSQMMAENIYDVPRTSSPHENSSDSFKKFKEKLFDRRLKQKFQNRLSVAKDFEISDMNSNCDDEEATAHHLNETDDAEVKSKLQERMQSLEREIHSFRQQNNELTKLIREYDIIRLNYDAEHRAAQERMENERINFEMYMHDQRLKMLDEKSKWEKKMKEGRAITQSEKDELVRLREKCANHEAELSAREQKHVSAQGRIRAQLRNVEKDLKETRIELESLQRENKKLEAENMRLRRQSNSKILTEINKSISKLSHSNEHDNQRENEKDGVNEKTLRRGVKKCSNMNAHKTVVAKVTCHRESSKGNRERSNSVPNLRSESTEKIAYELCSSSNVSEGENSESSSHEDKSNYFANSVQKDRFSSADEEEYNKHKSNQCDESDNISTGMKRVIENPDGSKDVWYQNGNLKKISADGMCIRMLYFNKDIKETDIKEGIVKYYYAETNTWQTTYLDGLEIFEYPDGQTEHRYKDGKVEIYFPNGTVRICNPAREQQEGIKEEWKYPDGSNAIQMTNGERMLLLPNGQREIHANGHKRREYPDGTVKIVYPDGSQETRYSNGRVRLKNKDGKLIMDSETISI